MAAGLLKVFLLLMIAEFAAKKRKR